MNKLEIKISTIAYGILCGYLLIKFSTTFFSIIFLIAIIIAEDIIYFYEFLVNTLTFS